MRGKYSVEHAKCSVSHGLLNMPWTNSAQLIRANPRHPWFSRRSSESIVRPRVGRIRVAAHFPEAEDVTGEKDNFADEFRPFPRITLRDDQARRAAVLLRQGLSVPIVRDEHVVVRAVIEWGVGRVTVIALEENVRGFRPRFDKIGDGEERHAFPIHVELAPGGDTVKVAPVFELWQRQKLFPTQRRRVLNLAMNLQLPAVEWNFRPNAKVENGKIVHWPLAGRQPVGRARRGFGLARHLPRPAFF